jgi:hypothetical protein
MSIQVFFLFVKPFLKKKIKKKLKLLIFKINLTHQINIIFDKIFKIKTIFFFFCKLLSPDDFNFLKLKNFSIVGLLITYRWLTFYYH